MKRKQSLLEAIDGRLAVTGVVCGLMGSFALQPVRAQGVIWYNIRVPTTVVAHVYGPEVSDPTLAKIGNTASETPVGTQTYTGAVLEGSGWSAQLFSAYGSGQPESSLVPVATSLTTFRTGSVLGGTFTPSVQAIPNVPPAQTGTFQLRVWDNQGGTIASWSMAEPLWGMGSIAAGKSILFDLQPTDNVLILPTEMAGFRSFNVYFVPEPSAIALAILGGSALLLVHLRRRRPLPHALSSSRGPVAPNFKHQVPEENQP
jgi:hypothetical protein